MTHQVRQNKLNMADFKSVLNRRIDTPTRKEQGRNGSPDRRFANNYQIPIVKYGGITSKSGLNEVYMISNAALVEGFAAAFAAFQGALSQVVVSVNGIK
ncbi:MAG: hypothetical protein C5B55_09410 [Blastocatellia bacterium]|nr:MAG: hypothetical protein C5B55_09410 [Blastocatellia bacterium]